MRYKQNLRVEGDIDEIKVYSYNTLVAEREGNKLIVPKHYSVTTSKHINYVADEYGLKVVKLYK